MVDGPVRSASRPFGPLVCRAVATLWLLLAAGGQSLAASYEIDRDKSVFAVITHRAGFAKALAHDHLVYPQDFHVTISGTPPDFPDPAFELAFRAQDLVVDAPTMQVRWFPRIEEAGILEEPFPEVSAGDRAEIRASMLGEGQLDAAAYPEITASLRALTPVGSGRTGEFTHSATVEFSLHGRSVARKIPVRITTAGGMLTVEGVGRFRFTSFGIEPFSAFFGAVKNRDRFHIYVHLTAHAEQAAPRDQGLYPSP